MNKAKNSEIREEGMHWEPFGNHVRTMCEACGKFGKSFDIPMKLSQAILDKIARKNTTFTQEIATLRQRLCNFPEGNASCVDRSGGEGAVQQRQPPLNPRRPEDFEECVRVQQHLGWNSPGH